MDAKSLALALQNETEKVIVGKSEVIKKVILAIFSGGNVLFSDLPGTGKTTLAKAITLSCGLSFNRIQFVSDMLPSDIIGMNIYNQKSGEFELRKGPVVTNILLADEINRAIPRTQSALLEAMEEHQITIDGSVYPLPSPFIVLATQNPVENESTFALPVAQMDRFLLSLSIGYPEEDDEIEMLKRNGDSTPFSLIKTVASTEDILAVQEECRNVFVSEEVERYIVNIVSATRKDERLKMGGSPRASRSLYQAAKSKAAMEGRDYVNPTDIKEIAHSVLSHRLLLSSSARYSSLTVDSVIDDILSSVEVPESLNKRK